MGMHYSYDSAVSMVIENLPTISKRFLYPYL